LVVTFGFLSAIKGMTQLYLSLERARDRIPELRWRIIGPFNPDRDPHHAVLANELRGDWVEFVGGRDPDDPVLRHWLSEAAVMALPFADGASARRTSLHTAWAFGLPVVTTPPPCPDDVVRPGVNCLVAPLDRPDLWEAAVSDILTDEACARRLAEASRETAQRYGLDELVQAHLQTYDAIIDRQQVSPK
jgi:glycosyltransferase involved in cell wall biosynthesis